MADEERKTITIDLERYCSDERLLDFYCAVLPWGARDIRTALDWIGEAGEDIDVFAEYLEQWGKDTETPLGDLDVAALALEYIAREAGADQLNDHLYGNYMCSSFDISEKSAGEILYGIEEDDRGKAWRFLVEFTDAEKPETVICPVCGYDYGNDAYEETMLADHGKCWECHNAWQFGRLHLVDGEYIFADDCPGTAEDPCAYHPEEDKEKADD